MSVTLENNLNKWIPGINSCFSQTTTVWTQYSTYLDLINISFTHLQVIQLTHVHKHLIDQLKNTYSFSLGRQGLLQPST